jgi:hypothetical protein
VREARADGLFTTRKPDGMAVAPRCGVNAPSTVSRRADPAVKEKQAIHGISAQKHPNGVERARREQTS